MKYLNTLPLVAGLEAWREVELVAAAPSRLAPMLRSGDVDVALASVVDAVGGDSPLALLPAGMIGCDGPTLTVRLYSRVPLDRATTLDADSDSHTSVVLARLVLATVFGAKPVVMAFDAGEQHSAARSPETLLLIGDKVVTDAPAEAEYPHQVDLGEAWKGLTGLPFVYALWMCREQDAGSERIAVAGRVLERQRLRNQMRLDWIVDRFAIERRWPADLARHYVRDLLRYDVGEREREAVERFLGEAGEMGLLPRGEVRWADAARAETES